MPNSLRQECLYRVGKVLGRVLSEEEGREILQTIRSSMVALSREDPDAWTKLTRDDRVSKAAHAVAVQIYEQGQRKALNLRKQALIQDRLLHKMDRLATEEDIHAYSAVAKILQDVYGYSKGVTNEYLTSMLDTLNGIGTKWLGFVENPQDVRNFVYEAFGQETGNERAAAAWKAFSETSEAMRQRAISAGAEIGKLDYGYIPQSHDSWKVRRASKILPGDKKGDSRTVWIDFIMPLLDRSRYVDDAGNRMADADLRDLLSGAYDDIITSGSPDSDIFDIAQNQPQLVSQRFKKYHHRTIHFSDADSYLTYESKFGRGSMTGAIVAHVAKMSNDIAILEKMGPKPKASFQKLKYVADRAAENAQATEGRFRLLSKYSDWQGLTDASIDDMWNVLTGIANRSALNREGIANFMQGWRNLEMAGKLGKAFITSFSDIPSYFLATGFNRLPLLQGARFFITAYGSDWKEYAERAGILAEDITANFNRWSSDNLGQGWTAKLSNASMRASLLNAFTDGTRRAFSLNMMASLGKLIRKNWDELDDYDLARLQDGGIDQATWNVFQLAGVDQYKGIDFLTIEKIKQIDLDALPEGITRRAVLEAPSKLLGFIINESEMASLNPDLVTRAETTRGAQRGTMKGELSRAFFLFKSFPISMMEKHFRRAQFLHRHGSTIDQLSYAAGITVATTFFGAVSLQVQNLLNGKDIQDVESSEFWLNAFTKGGGLGFLGDFIANGLSENSRMGAWGLASLLGPQVSTVVETNDLIHSVVGQGLYDKETQPAARAIRLVRSHMPFVNLWYTGTAIDRAVMNDLQEYLSPGYTQRMERRLYRSWGQEYWWSPREKTPRRAPRMAQTPR